MKRSAVFMIAIGALLMTTAVVAAARVHHRVVIDASTPEESWEGILNNVENLRKAFGGETSAVEVVAHGRALGLLSKDGKWAERVTQLAAAGVVFAACENTMRRQNVTREGLNAKAITVPSGVAELVKKQEAGWSYIKAGG